MLRWQPGRFCWLINISSVCKLISLPFGSTTWNHSMLFIKRCLFSSSKALKANVQGDFGAYFQVQPGACRLTPLGFSLLM